jgi:HprK-related kinase A
MTQLTIPASCETLSLPDVAVPSQTRLRSEVARHYRIGAVAVSLRSDLPRVQADFHSLYRTYRIDRAPTGTFHIEVRTKRSWRSGRRYYHILGNQEELFVTRRPDAVLPHVEWAVNSLAARYLPGHLQIHASVMCRDGIGVVFVGSPGQGKSTLAAGLLARGWSYLSDEFALIDPITRRLAPYPKALCIKAGSFDVLRRAGLAIDLARIYHKGAKGRVALLDPLAVRPDVVAEPCPIGMIVFPEYGQGKPPIIESISRAQAVLEMTRVSFNFVKFRRRGFDLLADVTRHARCVRLRTGELAETCQMIESCLDRAFSEAVA